MTSETANKRDFDVVVWGASGFTGKLVAAYLYEQYGAGADLRWAIGGRDKMKLEKVRAGLGADAGEIPILVGNSTDADAMAEIAASTSVVCSTVGPFAKYGTELVAACVRGGTHYCDITGEVQWMRRMIDGYEEEAQESGARIVHACGFDSIPSDLGCFYVNRAMWERHGVPCREVKTRVRKMKGAFSGGTVASILNAVEEARQDPDARRTMGNPYGLNPAEAQAGPDGPDQRGPAWDDDVDSWTAPFVMAAINTRVVRRSNVLMDYAYGQDFRYSEATMTGRGPAGWTRATMMTAGLGAFFAAASVGPARNLLNRMVLPQPGEGPSREQREAGSFELIVVGKHPQDRVLDIRARVTGDRDPGYGATSRMIGESAVCLAKDGDRMQVEGGFWTPASCLGDFLLKRLRRSAGMRFELIEQE
jgi:short subunit dehydrogenase-like uncharacterized protein